ncbi:MAG: hypothetical protein CMF96_04995 [Candidatus Marinimicrobia bacterium]|nr:hypothetical protein [Candidatus Neomarinimicrobiota bacterium]
MRIFLTILFSVLLLSADFTNDGAVLTIDSLCIVTFDGSFHNEQGEVHNHGHIKFDSTVSTLGSMFENYHSSTVEYSGDNQSIYSTGVYQSFYNLIISGTGENVFADDEIYFVDNQFDVRNTLVNLNTSFVAFRDDAEILETAGMVPYDTNVYDNYYLSEGGVLTWAGTKEIEPDTYVNQNNLGLHIRPHQTTTLFSAFRASFNYTDNGAVSLRRSLGLHIEFDQHIDIIFEYDESELNSMNESELLLFQFNHNHYLETSEYTWTQIDGTIDTESNTITSDNIHVAQGTAIFTASTGGGCKDPLAANYDAEAFGENGTCEYVVPLGAGNNLMSFPGTPALTSTQELLETITEQNPGCEVNFILGQGQGLFNTQDGWSGNLSEVNKNSGYWVNTSCSIDWLVSIPKREIGCVTYDIGAGNNLVSYIGEEGAETLPSIWEGDNFNFILGQGVGLFKTVDEWSGNLNNLSLFKGYWLNSSSTFNFSWGEECQDITQALASNIETEEKIFDVLQSTEQAFYLIKDLEVIGMNPQEGDWILAYRGYELIGSTEYEEGNTTLAVMGKDITEGTEHFPRDGELITLKIFNHKTMGVHDLNGEIPAWTSLGVSILDKLEGSSIIIPDNFVLEQPYPNPFNPTTTVKFGLPHDADVYLRIYDLQGRMIEELTQGYLTAGYHSFQWDADNLASGVYFVNLISKDFVSTQKLMLLK